MPMSSSTSSSAAKPITTKISFTRIQHIDIPTILIINKIDKATTRTGCGCLNLLATLLPKAEIVPISALMGSISNTL
jgi:GTPase Era involved in 16S rRNA processing